MDRNALNAILCAIVTTLDEVDDGTAPRTAVMLACSLDLRKYEFAESVMVKGGIAETTAETIRITSKGREIAKMVREHAAQA